jgi:hypothetical protein
MASLVGVLAPAPGASQEAPDTLEQAAMAWVELLEAERFDSAAARVAPAVRSQLGADRLRQVWPQLQAQLGELEELAPGSRSTVQGMEAVDLRGVFANGEVTVRVVFDTGTRVTGFFVLPSGAGDPGAGPGAWDPPAYADTTAFEEVELTVGSEPWTLPATLTLPRAEQGPVPGVVLVHGSGPQDRDETVGPNKPFRDLAWALATRGIAVLRYDKRTFVHAQAMMEAGEVGVDAVVVDDALAALELLRARDEVGGDDVFVVGHSLGGTLAPFIARRDGKVAGLVILAGAARSFSTLVRDQMATIRELPENAAPETQEQIDSVMAVLDRYRAGALPDTATFLGSPVAYARELDALRPVEALAELDVPALLLQGGRDYQVTVDDDIPLWREGLAGRDGVTIRVYPDLSHLFTPGEGLATPQEYLTRASHVDRRVVEEVARWIGEVAAGS